MNDKKTCASLIYLWKSNKEIHPFYHGLFQAISAATSQERTRISFGFANEVSVFEEFMNSEQADTLYAFFNKYNVIK